MLTNIPEPKLIKEGWLVKRGEQIKNCRPRYFILYENGDLKGFKLKPEKSDFGASGEPLNRFTVRGCQVIKTDKPKPYTFLLKGIHWSTVIERTFYTDSDTDRNDWCQAIDHVNNMFNVNSSSSLISADEDTDQDIYMMDLKEDEEMTSRLNITRNSSSSSRDRKIDDSTSEWHCPVCDTKCDSQHSFTLHIRQHNPTDHSHTCSICGKTLSSASSLDRHMLIHSGERPFKCKICNMTFTTNGNMHRHMRTHGMESNENDAPDNSNNNGNSTKSHQNSPHHHHHRNLKGGYSSNANKNPTPTTTTTNTTTTNDGDNDQDDNNNSTIINNNNHHHKMLGRKRGGGGKGKGTGVGVSAMMMTTNDDETHPENLSSMTSSDINLAISSLLLLSSSSSSTTTTTAPSSSVTTTTASNTKSSTANDKTKVNLENDVLPLQPLSSSTPISSSSSSSSSLSSPTSRSTHKSSTLLADTKTKSIDTNSTSSTAIPTNCKNQKTLSSCDRSSSHNASSLTSSSSPFTSSLSPFTKTLESSSNGKKMNFSSSIAPTSESKLRKQKSPSQSTSHSKVESIRCNNNNNLYEVSSSSLSKQHCTASSSPSSSSLSTTSPTTTTTTTTTSNTNSKSGIKRNNGNISNDDNNNNNGINSGYASIGFHDLTFTDFSSHKYPLIAQSFCEANIRKSSSPYHDFQCSNCPKAFPCASALSLHLQTVHPHLQHNETLTSSSPFAPPITTTTTTIDPTSLGLGPTNRALFSPTFCHLCQLDLGSPVLYLTHQAIHQYESIFHAVNGVNLTTSARTATSSSSPPSSSSTTSSPSNFLKAIVTNPTINSPTTTTTTTTTSSTTITGGKLPSITNVNNNDNADDDGINNGSSEEREEDDDDVDDDDDDDEEEEEMDNDNDDHNDDDHHSANSDNEKEQFLAMLQLYKKNKIILNNSNKINDANNNINNINSLVKVHPSIDGSSSSSSLLLKDEKNHFDYPSYFINAKVTLNRFNIPSTITTSTSTPTTTTTSTSNNNIKTITSNNNNNKINTSSNNHTTTTTNNNNSLLAKSKLNLPRTSTGKINGHSNNNSIKTKESKKRPNRGHTKGSHNYACNLCPYTSMDKSTLVRHLRTHNGERPFQCAICKYAFTTKANCERHVRKRHKKTSKPEIKSAMLFNAGLTTSSSQPLDLAVHALDLSYKSTTSSSSPTTTTNQQN